MDIQDHKFCRNVTAVEPNMYGVDKRIERGELVPSDDIREDFEVVELYTDSEYISISKDDVIALAIHFRLDIEGT